MKESIAVWMIYEEATESRMRESGTASGLLYLVVPRETLLYERIGLSDDDELGSTILGSLYPFLLSSS